ncbi:MAG: hypothetical protein QOJ74_1281, partial [Ilumatobacteraceae bacterium]|nr:hypothetical protein [Ilumatobacteraceae bacterium]
MTPPIVSTRPLLLPATDEMINPA